MVFIFFILVGTGDDWSILECIQSKWCHVMVCEPLWDLQIDFGFDQILVHPGPRFSRSTASFDPGGGPPRPFHGAVTERQA